MIKNFDNDGFVIVTDGRSKKIDNIVSLFTRGKRSSRFGNFDPWFSGKFRAFLIADGLLIVSEKRSSRRHVLSVVF